MRSTFVRCSLLAAVAVGGFCADASEAALAQLNGGAGYSGTLSRNKAVRKQQLICDPATSSGGPIYGSTSVTYDPSIVSLSGLISASPYYVNGYVEVQGEGGAQLQNINDFLNSPNGSELGYVQVSYFPPESPSVSYLAVVNPTNDPGHINPDPGFTTIDSDGVDGFDTHALFFTYLAGVPDSTVATYKIFAASQGQYANNDADSVTGMDAEGNYFTLGADDLSSATVSGNLGSSAVPLPPAVWGGLIGLIGLCAFNRRFARMI